MSRSNEILFALKIYSWAMFWIPTSWGLLFKKNFLGLWKFTKSWKNEVWVRFGAPYSSWKLLSEPIWTNKNRTQLTFVAIKIEPSVVWPSRLFLRIDMIPKKCASTSNMSWNLLENFFRQPKVKVSTRLWYVFDVFSALLDQKWFRLALIRSEPPKKRTRLTFLTIKIVICVGWS